MDTLFRLSTFAGDAKEGGFTFGKPIVDGQPKKVNQPTTGKLVPYLPI